MSEENPIIIIGAGVVGLVLAQALEKSKIPYKIYDRDSHIDARGHGWGITIHWALPALQTLLPAALFEKLQYIQVDPEQGRQDTGQFLFLDLATCEPVFRIPPSKRLRINREGFRKLLLEDIDVEWGYKFESFEDLGDEGGVTVIFENGKKVKGSLLVGADGATSKLRKTLCPDTGSLNQLPIRFLGVTLHLTPEEIAPLRALDPLLFQGCHPITNTYLWYSTLSTPEVNGSLGSAKEYYSAQLNISWAWKGPEDDAPSDNAGKLQKMKELSEGFDERLRERVLGIPEETEVLEIVLADWPCLEWEGCAGKVTLIGDAAHAMVMYRGEAANHGIMDVASLFQQLTSLYTANGKMTQRQAVKAFEAEMRDRTVWAVGMSRQACLDAHDFGSLNKDSAILARRAKRPE